MREHLLECANIYITALNYGGQSGTLLLSARSSDFLTTLDIFPHNLAGVRYFPAQFGGFGIVRLFVGKPHTFKISPQTFKGQRKDLRYGANSQHGANSVTVQTFFQPHTTLRSAQIFKRSTHNLTSQCHTNLRWVYYFNDI